MLAELRQGMRGEKSEVSPSRKGIFPHLFPTHLPTAFHLPILKYCHHNFL